MRQQKSTRKTSISVMKRAFSIIAVVAIVASMYGALAIESYVAPTLLNVAESTNNSLKVNGTWIARDPNLTYPYFVFAAYDGNEADTKIYLFTLTSGFMVFVTNKPNQYWIGSTADANMNPQGVSSYSIDTYDDTTGLYYDLFDWQPAANTNIAPVFNNIESGLQACVQYFPDESYSIEYSLPAGNVAFIEVGNGFDGFYLATTQPFKSGLDSTQPFSGSSQVWGMTNELPTTGTNINEFVNGSNIPWTKGTGVNILGQTDNALYTGEGPFPNKKYLVIINPMYANYYEGTNPLNNNSVLITIDQVKSLSVYSLTTTSTIESGMVTNIQTTVTGGEYQGEIAGEPGENGTISWTDPDGGSTEPSTGTGNVESTGVGPFQSWLQGILEKIVEVFQPAHNAITTLSQSVTNFGSWMRALYIWLPAPVLNLLTSAITLAIVIGVIKVFI